MHAHTASRIRERKNMFAVGWNPYPGHFAGPGSAALEGRETNGKQTAHQ